MHHSRGNFQTAISDAVRGDLQKLDRRLSKQADSGLPVDLSALFHAFTLSSFVKMAFSVELHNLESDQKMPFERAFEKMQVVILNRFLNPFWPITERFSRNGKAIREASCFSLPRRASLSVYTVRKDN